jgi:hypothetical protein
MFMASLGDLIAVLILDPALVSDVVPLVIRSPTVRNRLAPLVFNLEMSPMAFLTASRLSIPL